MKRTVTLLLSLLVACALNLHAEETDRESQQAATQPVENDTPEAVGKEPVKADPPSKRRERETDIFQPSEEISEDFAVSFPVDI